MFEMLECFICLEILFFFFQENLNSSFLTFTVTITYIYDTLKTGKNNSKC